MFQKKSEMFSKYIWNVSEHSKMFSKQIWKSFNHSEHCEVFSSIFLETFREYFFQHTMRCFQTNLNVSERSKIFANKLELFLIISTFI